MKLVGPAAGALVIGSEEGPVNIFLIAETLGAFKTGCILTINHHLTPIHLSFPLISRRILEKFVVRWGHELRDSFASSSSTACSLPLLQRNVLFFTPGVSGYFNYIQTRWMMDCFMHLYLLIFTYCIYIYTHTHIILICIVYIRILY